MFKSVLRVPVISSARPAIQKRAALFPTSVRLNSNKSINNDDEPIDLAKEVEKIESQQPVEIETPKQATKPEDPDELAQQWLSAIKDIRKQITTEGVSPVEKESKSKWFEKFGFEPTPEQIAKMESLEERPIPLKHDPVVEHFTNMIMKDGKKARAQRVMNNALYIVKLQLRKDPVEVLKEILDKMSPLMAIRTQKSRAAKSVVMPVPLTERQRHRTTFLWILEGAEKRRSPDFEVRLGEELIAAYEGKSSGYDKRLQIHKTAMLQRAYVKLR
ncbi:30S ribosomal protein S7 [Wickerhamomyces ciferrii]|uniref:Small ribosomal subunit protein uS7m n=1 Tax=Wickerhamomyces ciferrii (strain ATCC 14091 / BCRC 22168 / CBS 111 / JCM 3599 / NBRC 0793 / NRRL Y-1031 F-60-10) TaxID=1206466 RepID=K0KLR9_WICCF|nr:30S ribosomal protein S7 [Wickerhamomyces ciferrii]CCH42264.1 30S ribosomal protein S7 [Wickerhamomyces ciferrii]